MIIQPEPCKNCRFAETWYHGPHAEYMFTYSCAAGIPEDGDELNMYICKYKTRNPDLCRLWTRNQRIKVERS